MNLLNFLLGENSDPFNLGLLSKVGLFALIGMIFRVVWNTRIPSRKLKIESDQKLISNLLGRVEKLENDNENLRKDYDKKIDIIKTDFESREALNESREALLRHELQNIRTCFNAMIMFLKRIPDPPEALTEIILDIEIMRAEQVKSEDLERAALFSAKIVPDKPTPAHD